ncbi:MAG: bifunctional nicotinamidase/pyrazinamidase [Deltaproteobacteria bacterium]|nr:bifunctional nicotinamidase/pyrazinamidase [Deltaproteobacteria bacterium]
MRALILVDLQRDFLPGGALAVPRSDEVIPVANALQAAYDLVVATQDFHPRHHLSFAANHPDRHVGEIIDLDGLKQLLWPVHCVQGSNGAAFATDLDPRHIARVFPKGEDPRVDSYSGFFDNGKRKATGLGDYLQERAVDEVHVLGLATDYCVKFTALDAISLGFTTSLIVDGCRGVELKLGDVDRALDALREAGVTLRRSADILQDPT